MNNNANKTAPSNYVFFGYEIKKGSMFFTSPTIPNRLIHFRDGLVTILASDKGSHDSLNILADVRRISKRKAIQMLKGMKVNFSVNKG